MVLGWGPKHVDRFLIAHGIEGNADFGLLHAFKIQKVTTGQALLKLTDQKLVNIGVLRREMRHDILVGVQHLKRLQEGHGPGLRSKLGTGPNLSLGRTNTNKPGVRRDDSVGTMNVPLSPSALDGARAGTRAGIRPGIGSEEHGWSQWRRELAQALEGAEPGTVLESAPPVVDEVCDQTTTDNQGMAVVYASMTGSYLVRCRHDSFKVNCPRMWRITEDDFAASNIRWEPAGTTPNGHIYLAPPGDKSNSLRAELDSLSPKVDRSQSFQRFASQARLSSSTASLGSPAETSRATRDNNITTNSKTLRNTMIGKGSDAYKRTPMKTRSQRSTSGPESGPESDSASKRVSFSRAREREGWPKRPKLKFKHKGVPSF